ncbi:hypothetical protein ALO79_200043 [Pseudomonas syringae pv. castaneae]|uniref:Uncharacterized protein n=1 Tax=Pseudomonas syringae pv. castaneae TaxID=264450 RepID=A0A0P9NLZ0_PSESX|nr:hypothetical protein ALO79_200043 [Pseudomonas syringae pv. castaneae]
MQGPDTEHIVDLPFALGRGEAPDKQGARNGTSRQRAYRVHQIGTGTDRHQPGQRTVVQEAGVVASNEQCRHCTADHGHQRIDRHQTAHPWQGLGAHHVETEPTDNQDPRPQGQEWNARRRERHQAPLPVTAVTRPEQQHGRQRQPAAHGMHDHGAGKVVETGTEAGQQPGLEAEISIPDDAFEEWIHECHDQHRGTQLRRKACTFGNTAGYDRRDGGGESQQEKKLHQAVAVIGAQHRGRLQERHAVGNPVAYKEIGQGRDGKIAENLRQRIDLVFLPDSSNFQERKAGMHGQDHDRTQQDEQSVGTVDQTVHSALHIFHGVGRPEKVERSTKAARSTRQRTKLRQLACRLKAGEPLWCVKNGNAMFRCEVLRGF